MRQLQLLACVLLALVTRANIAQCEDLTDSAAVQQLIGNKEADWDLGIQLNHQDGIYREGDALSLTLNSPRRCFLHIFNVTPDGELKVLWPQGDGVSNRVEAEQQIIFPDPDARPAIRFIAEKPLGKELLICLATTAPLNLRNRDDARKFSDFLESLKEEAPMPVVHLRSFVTKIERESDSWVARAIHVQTRERQIASEE